MRGIAPAPTLANELVRVWAASSGVRADPSHRMGAPLLSLAQQGKGAGTKAPHLGANPLIEFKLGPFDGILRVMSVAAAYRVVVQAAAIYS